MSRKLDAMRRNPRNDWRIEDVIAVCREAGAHCDPPRSGGSHYKIAHPDLADILTVPFKRPIKPIYISQAGGVSRRGSEAMKGTLEYPVIISPLSFEDGGGFAASVPDLPGCISDGETPEDALANVRDAIAMWLEAAGEMGRPIPAPSPPKALA